MRSRFQFKQPSKRTMIIGTVVLGSLLIYGLTQINYQCDWTGFGVCDFVAGSDEDYRPEKTLWDWLGLLIIPTVLALGALYFNRAERRNELEIAQKERQNELKIAEERAKTDHEIADDRLREEALQAYLDRMSELLIEHELRKSEPDAEVRAVARARTLTVVGRLDGKRKGAVLQFLQESYLINRKNPIITLDDADLSHVIFRNGNLREANLQGANLAAADLPGANLQEANLENAKLQGANLRRANLSKAALYFANFQRTNLEYATLGGTYLEGTDLTESNLEGARIKGAFLHNAVLEGANLKDANCRGAGMEFINLEGANLRDADMQEVRLKNANVTIEQLAQAKSLKGATMPDGSIHP